MKTGRNDPCICGSGKKYKNCCLGKAVASGSPSPAEIDPLYALNNYGRFAELEIKAGTLVSRYPDCGPGWQLLGRALQMQGKNAMQAFQRAAKLLPGNADIHHNLGIALKSAGLLADAESSFRRAIKIKPDFAEAHNSLGMVLQDLGQHDAAISSCRNAVNLNRDYAFAYYNLGNAQKELGQFDNAAGNYRRAIELQPGFAEAHHGLGLVLKGLGKLEPALASFRKSLELKPVYAEAHNNLGPSRAATIRWSSSAACPCCARPDSAVARTDDLAFSWSGIS